MINLFIDAGWASIGYCVYDKGVRGDYGEFHYSQKDRIERLHSISKDLHKLIKASGAESVFCEDFKIHGRIGARGQNVLLMIGCLLEIVNGTSIKMSLVNFSHWKSLWKKIENKPCLLGIKEHAADAIMMGFALEGGLK